MIFVWAYLGISAIASIVLIAACAMAKRADNYFLDEEPYIHAASLRATTPTTTSSTTAVPTSRTPLSGEQMSDAAQAAG